jgi:protein O-mannosyl-transferase
MAPIETPSDDDARRVMTDRTLAALLVVTALACAPSLTGTFFWDDLTLVAPGGESARAVHGLDAFTQPFFVTSDSASMVAYWRPAVALFYLALRTLFGANPVGYHAAVVSVHLAAVCLAARLARRLLGDRPLAIALAAGLFALHPSRWVSVYWVSGSPDPLFALAAIPLLTLAVESPRTPPPTARTALSAALLTALALTTKETALALPFLAAALAYTTATPDRARPRALHVALPSLACVVVYLVARALWLPMRPAAMRSPALVDHALAVLATVWLLVKSIVWPLPLAASRDIGFLLSSKHFVMPATALVGGVSVIIATTVWFARSKRARPGLALAAGFILPVSNLAWTGFMFLTSDRFLYLPALGVGLALAASLPLDEARNTVRAGVFALLAVCGLTLTSAATHLRDPVTFWRAEVAAMPTSSQAREQLAAALTTAGRPGEAFVWRYRALRLFLDHDDDAPLVERWTLDMLGDLASRIDDEGRETVELRDLLTELGTDTRRVRGRVGDLDIDLRRRAPPSAMLAAQRLALQADLASRAGDDDLAARYLADARCEDCAFTRVVSALIAARLDRRDEALARCPPAMRPRLDAAFRERDHATAMRARGNVTGALAREVEADLILAAPRRARRRLEGQPETPALTIARARVEAEEFHFARAEALVAPLRASANPAVRAALSAFDARADRRRADALPRVVAP